MAGPIHYEVYTRKTVASGWALEQAVESRERAVSLAEDLLTDKRAVSVRVTKETLDVETMDFQSVTILTRGAPEPPRPSKVRANVALQPCNAPADLYTAHARALIGRVLDDWLARHRATPFELLHRPDLVELLEASGIELQHAIQKVSVPESQASGQPVHDLVRHYQRLIETASQKLIKIGRGGGFADLGVEPIGDMARRAARAPDRAFLIGGAIVKLIAPVRSPRARLDVLMNVADTAPDEPQAGAAVQAAVEALTIEMLATREGLLDILGPALDLGGQMAGLMRIVGAREAEMLMAADPRLKEVTPMLDGPAERLATRISAGGLKGVAAAVTRQVLHELNGPRRLRPSDAAGEIEILRALAMLLTAQAGRLLTLEAAQSAFSERSKSLIAADFVASYIGSDSTPLEEAQALVRLCENVTGSSAKRSASRWLAAVVTALKFETAMRDSTTGAAQRLGVLAEMQAKVRACDLAERDEAVICDAIGHVGGLVEADAKLTAQLGRAAQPPAKVLSLLLRMAMGEGCPTGPAANRAKAEALKLLKSPQTRRTIAEEPQVLMSLRPLIQAAGLAA